MSGSRPESRSHRRTSPERLVRLTAVALIAVLACVSAGNGLATATPTATSTSAAPAIARTQVRVFFPRGNVGPNCRRVLPLTRTVPGPGVLRGAMDALLRGPTATERTRGYGGWFSSKTAGRVRSVRIVRSVARIDFRDFSRIIPNASTSCGSALLLAQLNRTARQFPSVTRAVYSFDGSVSAFYEWLQLDPPPT